MTQSTHPLPRLHVPAGGRQIVTEQGEAFFWLGDTAWELFHRLSRDEARLYLKNRSEKRFTVIQAVALAEVDGLNTPNYYGERPLIDNDPTRPNEAYFRLVDEYIQMAETEGLYIGLLPTWGDKVAAHMWGAGPVVFTPENTYAYGAWLGKRYRDQTNIIWVLGGDRPPFNEKEDNRPVWREMARGIREAVGAPLVMTYHPWGGHSSGEWLHEEPWLDVNMMQSGHGGGHDVPVWDMIQADYLHMPVKPTLDGEPNYEDHPVSPWPKWDPANGYFRDHDVRKQLYRSVFAGACGVTYGHHSIWQFFQPGRDPITFPDRDWHEALDRPGAQLVRHLRTLVEARTPLTRVPDQSLIEGDSGEGGNHAQAMRDENGRWAMVYVPDARPVRVNLKPLGGIELVASWYDPRSGAWTPVERVTGQRVGEFTPPPGGPDWVLVLDQV